MLGQRVVKNAQNIRIKRKASKTNLDLRKYMKSIDQTQIKDSQQLFIINKKELTEAKCENHKISQSPPLQPLHSPDNRPPYHLSKSHQHNNKFHSKNITNHLKIQTEISHNSIYLPSIQPQKTNTCKNTLLPKIINKNNILPSSERHWKDIQCDHSGLITFYPKNK